MGGRWRREDDPETQDGRAGHARAKRFWRNFQILTRRYIYLDPVGVTEWNNSVDRDVESQAVTATRCDRMVLIGCTEIENLDQLNELGLTEKDESVRPKCTERFWKFKSMTNR